MYDIDLPSPVLRLSAPRKVVGLFALLSEAQKAQALSCHGSIDNIGSTQPTALTDRQHMANVVQIEVRKPAGLTDEQWAAQIRATMSQHRGVIHLCPEYDTADHLETLQAIGLYIQAVIEDGDPQLVAYAPKVVARAAARLSPELVRLNTLARADGVLAQRIDQI